MPTNSGAPCFELSHVLEVFAARWKSEILWHLRGGPLRFNALRRLVGPVSQKMLASQLRALERDGLVVRKQFNEVPARVEYSTTELATSLYPVIEDVYQWWSARWGEVERSRKRYDRRKKRTERTAASPE